MKNIGLLLALTFSMSSFAAGYDEEIDNFFSLMQKGEVEKAVSAVYSSNPYVSAIPDQVKQVNNQLSSLSGLVGNLITLNKIGTYKVGDSFVHVTYIAIYDRQPIRFEFQFFKVEESWRIYSLSFDDDLNEEIKMLARKRALQAD